MSEHQARTEIVIRLRKAQDAVSKRISPGARRGRGHPARPALPHLPSVRWPSRRRPKGATGSSGPSLGTWWRARSRQEHRRASNGKSHELVKSATSAIRQIERKLGARR
jgi:hypothetical protein